MYCDNCASKGRTYKFFLIKCVNCNIEKPMHTKEKVCNKCSENNVICQKCGLNVLTGEKIGRQSVVEGRKSRIEENWEMGKKGILQRIDGKDSKFDKK